MAETNIMSCTDFVRKEIVDSYSDNEFIDKWNDYCEDNYDPDSQIVANNEDFLALFSKKDIASKICYGEYSINDDYVTFDGYANFKSSSYPEDLGSKEDLTDWIVENQSEEDAYIDYVEQQIKELSLNEALQSYADIADRHEYIRDDSVSQIEIAIENSLETLVENSSIEEIKAAIKLNRSEELIDLSDLKDYVNLDELALDTQHKTAQHPHSLADDLQAAQLAADKQETVNPQGTLKHTNKL